MPIGTVAYASTLLWDNLGRNSCIWNNLYLNCGRRWKRKIIIAVNFPISAIGKKKPEKFRASTWFEPVTSAIPVRCSTNWAMKPHIASEVVVPFTGLQSLDSLSEILWECWNFLSKYQLHCPCGRKALPRRLNFVTSSFFVYFIYFFAAN